MPIRRNSSLGLVIASLAFGAFACNADGGTGPGRCNTDVASCSSGSGGGGAGGPYALASLDAVCGSVTGRMVLSAAQPQYAATLAYTGEEPNAGTTTPLTLGIVYAEGAITCYPPIAAPPGTEVASEAAHVTLVVTVHIATQDGAFAESLSGTLDGFDASSATLSASVPRDQIAGSYDPQMTDLTDVTVTFDGTVAGATTNGSVMKGGQKSAGVGETAFVANW